MGRPRKQTVDYFPHFVSTDSRTKFILEQSWGNDGYAFWFKLLELLGRSEGHYYDCTASANEKYLVALMKLEQTTIDEILATLADLGNIDKELWEERKVIWCQSLVDNLQDVYSKRTVSAPTRPFTEPPEEEKTPPPPEPPAPPPPTADGAEEPPKRKRGRPKKPEVPKVKYAEFVTMTEEEYEKLVAELGEEKAKRAIEILDNYKGQSGKTYKSDYRAILNWTIERVNEEFEKRGGGGHGGAYADRGHSGPAGPGDFKPSGGFKG